MCTHMKNPLKTQTVSGLSQKPYRRRRQRQSTDTITYVLLLLRRYPEIRAIAAALRFGDLRKPPFTPWHDGYDLINWLGLFPNAPPTAAGHRRCPGPRLKMGKSSRSESSSKADQKFEKKLQFYAKVRDTVAVLGAKKAIAKPTKRLRSRQKKLKAYDLSTLSEFLPDLKAPKQQPVSTKVNSKSRQKLVTQEEVRMKAVLNHPAFQADPLASIHQHLLSTQPEMDEKVQKKDKKKIKKKNKKSKASAGPQSMDI